VPANSGGVCPNGYLLGVFRPDFNRSFAYIPYNASSSQFGYPSTLDDPLVPPPYPLVGTPGAIVDVTDPSYDRAQVDTEAEIIDFVNQLGFPASGLPKGNRAHPFNQNPGTTTLVTASSPLSVAVGNPTRNPYYGRTDTTATLDVLAPDPLPFRLTLTSDSGTDDNFATYALPRANDLIDLPAKGPDPLPDPLDVTDVTGCIAAGVAVGGGILPDVAYSPVKLKIANDYNKTIIWAIYKKGGGSVGGGSSVGVASNLTVVDISTPAAQEFCTPGSPFRSALQAAMNKVPSRTTGPAPARFDYSDFAASYFKRSGPNQTTPYLAPDNTDSSPTGHYLGKNSVDNGLCFYAPVLTGQMTGKEGLYNTNNHFRDFRALGWVKVDRNGRSDNGQDMVHVETLVSNYGTASSVPTIDGIILDEKTRRPIFRTGFQPLWSVAQALDSRSNPRSDTTPFNFGQLSEAATTEVDAILVSGIHPSKKGLTYGGLQNYIRIMESWRDKTLKMRGSLFQINFSTSATGPWNLANFDAPSRYIPGAYAGFEYYQAPTRNFSYDVALQKVAPSAFAKRLSVPTNYRNEFITELPADDIYVRRLRCSLLDEPVGTQVADSVASAGCA
jgi:hypothetical protein